MKQLIRQRTQSGNQLAEQAAELEQHGSYSAASMLWSNAVNFPCDPINLEWRQHRAENCQAMAVLRPECGENA